MTVEVTDLTSLPQAEVDQQRDLITAMLQEFNPEVDVRRGAVHELVVQPSAALAAANQQNLDLLRRSGAVSEVLADPTLADDDVVDRLASNYLLSRKAGVKATGRVTVVVDTLAPVVVAAGTVFTIGGLTYVTDATYAARTSSALVLTDSDRLLTALEANRWGFDVDVTAAAVGPAYNARRAATATPSTTLPNFVKAYAAADFSGGVAAETNAELLGRLQSGLGVRAWSNRATIEAMIRAQAAFANVSALSIIGFGDPEMVRDQHAIWPGSQGGRVDVYLRSQAVWATGVVQKTATLTSKAGAVGTWQLSLTRDDVPGYYEVDRVQLVTSDATAAGFAAASDVRSYDATADATHEFVPDVTTATEAAYSRYQTATVTFADTVTDATSLTVGVSTKAYDVVVRRMPLVETLQDYLAQRSVRPTMCDVCVRGAVPCFTSVSFTVNVKKGVTAPTTAAIQNAVAGAVNALGFPGKLPASLINQVLHGLVPVGLVSVTNMAIAGRIRRPDGTTLNLLDQVVIAVPDEGASMVSGRTTAFLLDPADVAPTVVTVDTPAV